MRSPYNPGRVDQALVSALRVHPVGDAVAVEVDQIEVAHAVGVVLRCFDHLGAAFDQLRVNGIDVSDEHAQAAMARSLFSLIRGEEMQRDLVAAQADIEQRIAVLERHVEPERVA